jgi:hypothetical protein
VTITTVPSTIYVVTVDHRLDGVYAFTSEREANRFLNVLERDGGRGNVEDVPLNSTPDHTDDLIEAERDE